MKNINIHPVLLLSTLFLLYLTPISKGADLLVPSDYRTIQEAIDSAETGDRILVAAGTYTGQGFRGISFLGKAVTVEGAGMDQTILDCQQLDRGFDFQFQETTNSIVQNLTITNGLDGCGT